MTCVCFLECQEQPKIIKYSLQKNDKFGLLLRVPGAARTPKIWIYKLILLAAPRSARRTPKSSDLHSNFLDLFWLPPGGPGAAKTHQVWISKYSLMSFGCTPKCQEKPEVIIYSFQIKIWDVWAASQSARSSQNSSYNHVKWFVFVL